MFTRLNMNIQVESVDAEGVYLVAQIVEDQTPDPSYLEQEGWEDRKQEYMHGDFSYVGVIVTAYDDDDNEIGSSSLWGIETDSEPSYFAEVANDIAGEAIPA